MIDRVVSGPGLFYRRSEPNDGAARCGGRARPPVYRDGSGECGRVR